MIKKLASVILLSVLFTATALAKSHICTSFDHYTRTITDGTKFQCTGGLPNMTLKEIIAQGYRIVSIAASNISYGDPKVHDYLDWAIVIEKDSEK